MASDDETDYAAQKKQEVNAGRDANTAGRDLSIVNNYYGLRPQYAHGDGLPRVTVPGRVSAIWNLPPRNLVFTGRESSLTALRSQLTGGHRSVVHALNGMGGVGKTQLAVEYAHRFSGEYDLAW